LAVQDLLSSKKLKFAAGIALTKFIVWVFRAILSTSSEKKLVLRLLASFADLNDGTLDNCVDAHMLPTLNSELEVALPSNFFD
jgi:hypothetical protein